jgi:hypothetical protein
MSPFPQLSALRSCWVSAVSRGCPEKNFQDMLERNKRKKKKPQELGEHQTRHQTRMYFFHGLKFVKSPVVKQTWHTRKQT